MAATPMTQSLVKFPLVKLGSGGSFGLYVIDFIRINLWFCSACFSLSFQLYPQPHKQCNFGLRMTCVTLRVISDRSAHWAATLDLPVPCDRNE